MTSDIYIVIINYRDESSTISCIESIQNNIDEPTQIIVIDNDASSQSIAELTEWIEHNFGELRDIDNSLLTEVTTKDISDRKAGETDQLTYVPLTRNTGFTGGGNTGIEIALARGGEYVFLLNNDAVVSEGLLSGLLETIEEPEIGAVAPALVDGLPPDEKVNYPTRVLPCRGFESKKVSRSGSNGVYEVDFLSGAALLLDATVIEEVGLLRDDFFLYTEDLDLGLRIRDAGYLLCYDSNHVVKHDATPRGGISTYYGTRNRLYLIEERLSTFCLVTGLIWYLIVRLVHSLYWTSQGRFGTVFGFVMGIIDFARGRRGKKEMFHE